MKEPVVSKALKILLYIIFVLGVVWTATLPLMLDSYFRVLYDAYSLESGYHTFILVFLMLASALGLWIILEMIGMLRSIPQGPFIIRNVRALRRIGVILLALSALFFIKCVFYVTFLTMACGLLFILCGLFAFTMRDLFLQAVIFKDENDLTI